MCVLLVLFLFHPLFFVAFLDVGRTASSSAAEVEYVEYV